MRRFTGEGEDLPTLKLNETDNEHRDSRTAVSVAIQSDVLVMFYCKRNARADCTYILYAANGTPG